jgi:LysR family transcriptional regulator, low CO2-responsive transcriptional regulator
MVSLHQLRTFLAVAAAGSVREAAEDLVVSQPAVSSAVTALQRELGVALLERRGRGIVVTPVGRQVERDARRLFALLDDLERSAKSAARGGGRVRLAAVTTAAEHVLPALLNGFLAENPALDVDLEVANRAQVWEKLAHFEVDLAVAGRPPRDRGFTTLATSPNELVVIAPPGDTSSIEDLGARTWLLREEGSGTRGAAEEFFGQLGISPPRLTIGSNGAICACVRVGLGVSLQSRDAVRRDLESGALAVVPTPVTPIARAWNLVRHSAHELSPAALRLVAYLSTTGFAARTTS